MKRLFSLLILGGLLSYTPMAQAIEDWVEVSTSRAGDRILIDQNSIQRSEDQVSYWEYRDMRQPSSGEITEQPVYGMMIYRSVDCTARVSRMQRLVLFNQEREVIRRINYTAAGGTQPMAGSNAEMTIRYVCDRS